jgi:CDP-6-deoxy-D-xylo-4-hexulose-3-dehydrase
MYNNITRDDLNKVVDFLNQDPMPILTNSKKVVEFEEKWSKWVGKKYSVFLNSGSSANLLTMTALRFLAIPIRSKVIVPPLTWVSDIAAVLQSELTPVFCDISLKTLAIDEKELEKCDPEARVLFLTHVLGYNGLTKRILDICSERNMFLVEDVCESHGATYRGKKAGLFGDISNFSFYYAHHMTSIEGGMVCTDDLMIYQTIRMLRSHGMLRENTDESLKQGILADNPELNPDFVFVAPAYNMRSTEINAVIALNQLERLDANNKKRAKNLDVFLDGLDSKKFYTDFDRTGNSNYAFTLLLNDKDFALRDQVEAELRKNEIEFRRGMSGGGNQLRQPYLKNMFPDEYKKCPNAEHVHHFGWYIGNYPELETAQIHELTKLLNNI